MDDKRDFRISFIGRRSPTAMPSPFPGMDPFLEAQGWADFHMEMIAGIRAALMPRLRPRYVARVEERVYLEREPESPTQWIRPDVTIHEAGAREAAFVPDAG